MSLEECEEQALKDLLDEGPRPYAYEAARAARHPSWPGGFATFQTYLALYDYTSLRSNLVWPSKKKLARDTGLSVRMVTRHLAALERGGVIVRSARTAAGGRQTSNEYALPREPIETWSGEVEERRAAPMKPEGMTGVTPPRVTKMSGCTVTGMSLLEVVPASTSSTKQQAGLNLTVKPRSSGVTESAANAHQRPPLPFKLKARLAGEKALGLGVRLSVPEGATATPSSPQAGREA